MSIHEIFLHQIHNHLFDAHAAIEVVFFCNNSTQTWQSVSNHFNQLTQSILRFLKHSHSHSWNLCVLMMHKCLLSFLYCTRMKYFPPLPRSVWRQQNNKTQTPPTKLLVLEFFNPQSYELFTHFKLKKIQTKKHAKFFSVNSANLRLEYLKTISRLDYRGWKNSTEIYRLSFQWVGCVYMELLKA